MQTVEFTQLKDATEAECRLLFDAEQAFERGLPDRLLALLRAQGDESVPGFPVTRLEHALQTATRAEADGADDEWVVAAVLHDVGDAIASANHSEFAASILRPYMRPEVTWVIERHGVFQMQFYGHHVRLPSDGHLKYRDNPWFASAQRFVEAWDQAAFDPAYPTLPLEHFESRLRAIFSRRPWDPAVIPPNAAG